LPHVAILAWDGSKTHGPLVAAWRALGMRAELLTPPDAAATLGPGDVAICRLDVLPTLDGVQPGLDVLPVLERRGVRVLNRGAALLAAHDKLTTVRRLARAGIPHPRTEHRRTLSALRSVVLPVVLKPRFGSWGQDVFRCETAEGLSEALREIADRPWFRRHGVLVQELLPTPASDLRTVVAGGRVVGAASRAPAPGEWRTNVSLGGRLLRAEVTARAESLSIAAARALGADLVGVDLLPLPGGGYVVLELNGTVDFDGRYSLGAGDVFADAAAALGLGPELRATSASEPARQVARREPAVGNG
jgi:RimK family alpha-L-glutamate ligase